MLTAALLVAKPPQFGIVGFLGQIEGGIENQFPFLDPSARQPHDLHEELGAKPEQ